MIIKTHYWFCQPEGDVKVFQHILLCEIVCGVVMCYFVDSTPCQGSGQFVCQSVVTVIMPTDSYAYVLRLLKLLQLHDFF
jgi:hypothetical protein